MSIKVKLPRSLSGITKGKDLSEVDGETVGECLGRLVSLFPRIEKELFYSGTGESLATDGKLWSKVRVLVNGENINSNILANRVKAGDEIHIEIDTH